MSRVCVDFVGAVIENFDSVGIYLPNNGHMLKVLFHYIRRKKMTLSESISTVAQMLTDFWRKKSIPVKDFQRIRVLIQRKYDAWRTLGKIKARDSKTCDLKKKDFIKSLPLLFDISHHNAHALIEDQNVLKFLKDQQQGVFRVRNRYVTEAPDAGPSTPSTDALTNRIERRLSNQLSATSISGSQTTNSSQENSQEDPNFEPPPQKKSKVMTRALAASLDRGKISNRTAKQVIECSMAAVGVNSDEKQISLSTVYRARKRERHLLAEQLKMDVRNSNFLTVHWDGKGKKYPDGKKVELMPVIVSSGTNEQFLLCGLLPSGSGENTANAVHGALVQWDIENIIAMSFDTTATNTGIHNGACMRLERMLGRNLLHLACRHHVLELVLETAFMTCFEDNPKGPDVQMYKDFRDNWHEIDETQYETALEDDTIRRVVEVSRETSLQSLNNLETSIQPRADYLELLELARIFLGGVEQPQFKWPGAMHRARWMSKAIYTLKMYMFRSQVENVDIHGLRRMALWIVTCYLRPWFQAPLAVNAPANDLEFLKTLGQYHDREIAMATSAKFAKHLFYLSPELVCMAFFDDAVTVREKREMLQNLQKQDNGPRKPRGSVTHENFHELKLSSFVTSKSLRFFDITGINHQLLAIDPQTWSENEIYQSGQNICKNLRVVNDTAERGVATSQMYFDELTKDAEDWQNLLLMVTEDRKNG